VEFAIRWVQDLEELLDGALDVPLVGVEVVEGARFARR